MLNDAAFQVNRAGMMRQLIQTCNSCHIIYLVILLKRGSRISSSLSRLLDLTQHY